MILNINKIQKLILLFVTALLLIPLIAMQFSAEVKWTLIDFVAAAVLLTGAGFAIEFAIRKITNKKHRIAICITILGLLLFTWAALAVGIF
jgi:maltodextrin utilization protein YvdJ